MRPTESANGEERIARIEKMVAELAGVEQNARRLAADMHEKGAKIAAEAERVARAEQIVAELEVLEQKAEKIAAEVADKAAQIAAELAELKRATIRVGTGT
jgi:DNA repair ATPase RecN